MVGRSLASTYSCHALHDNPNYVLTEPKSDLTSPNTERKGGMARGGTGGGGGGLESKAMALDF